jgi:hypothetical protein
MSWSSYKSTTIESITDEYLKNNKLLFSDIINPTIWRMENDQTISSINRYLRQSKKTSDFCCEQLGSNYAVYLYIDNPDKHISIIQNTFNEKNEIHITDYTNKPECRDVYIIDIDKIKIDSANMDNFANRIRTEYIKYIKLPETTNFRNKPCQNENKLLLMNLVIFLF